jgi:transforming growth factor-beta-induced protein
MKNLINLFLFATLMMATLTTQSACMMTKKDIIGTTSEKAKTLTTAIAAAGLTETLKGKGPYTVFAPSDAAFATIQNDVDRLLRPENKAELAKLLTCHLVSGKMKASVLQDGEILTTLDGSKLRVSISNGIVLVEGAMITGKDLEASNGVVHVIDKVIMPAKPLEKDLIAVASESAKTLSAAVSAAGLVSTLQSAGPFTIFAPTDAAFAAIQKDVDKLMLPENKAKLSNILTYHVVPGKTLAAGLRDGQELITAQGGKLIVSMQDGKVKINGANVTATDIPASNGVIHVIDKVILPKM